LWKSGGAAEGSFSRSLAGADLMHLRDFSGKVAGTVSIGGAGTFDGTILSGIVAAYLA
jgi:uncharacterized membrane protein